MAILDAVRTTMLEQVAVLAPRLVYRPLESQNLQTRKPEPKAMTGKESVHVSCRKPDHVHLPVSDVGE